MITENLFSGETFIVPALKVTQPIGDFYICKMNPSDLVEISYSDVRRLESQQREIETYIGIERPLSPNRVRDIQKYVKLVDATFPSTIILSIAPLRDLIDSEQQMNIKYSANDNDCGTLEIRRDKNIAKVLDGQHRIKGLEGYANSDRPFQVLVAIFIDIELEDQAMVFATINLEQTKVNKSIVADLFEFARTRSPQKTAHNIARALNEKDGSPFKGKIKILGIAEHSEDETITQATFVEALIRYITRDKLTDRDLLKRGKKPARVGASEQSQLFLRDYFLEEHDSEIAQILWNYFSAISIKWPRAWGGVTQELILNRSTGFLSLMRFLKPAFLSLLNGNVIPSMEQFAQIMDKIDLKDDDFNRNNYIPGSGGQGKLYRDLLTKSGLSE